MIDPDNSPKRDNDPPEDAAVSPDDMETEHIEDEGEPLGANFA